jgi:serine/threonine protein phosphatase 1
MEESLMTGIHFLDARGPDGLRIYAIGDVHGRLDLLTKMYEAIAEHLESSPVADWRIVHLGDYVDRGPDSRGVLDFLIAAQQRDQRILALAGNHDLAFLEFLTEPDPNGLFANYGGRQTGMSYGVAINFTDPAAFVAHYQALCRAVPPLHRTFLEGLTFSLAFGDFFFCHAGIRPGVPLESQDPQDLVWIREAFLNYPELHPKVVVHGHTPTAEPEVRPNRVNVDTGAFMSGILTALIVEGADKQIMQVAA